MVKVNVSGDAEAPTMEAHSMAPSWNGNAVPIVTARTFRAYVAAERANDPNGEWYGETVETITGESAFLTYRRPSDFEDEGDRWQACDVDPTTGAPLYALDGWTWAEVGEAPMGDATALDTIRDTIAHAGGTDSEEVHQIVADIMTTLAANGRAVEA